jgi:hypothetical protein
MASARLAQFKRLRLLDWRYGAIFIVGVVSLVFSTFQQHPKIVGFIPVGNPLKSNFRTKWVGVITTSTQAKQAKAARELTRFQPKTSSFPVYVVSLTDAHARRESVTAELELRNITFSWVDAVNGAGEMPEDLVKWYSSQSRFRRYKQADVGSRAYRKMACDLSHLLLMHRMIARKNIHYFIVVNLKCFKVFRLAIAMLTRPIPSAYHVPVSKWSHQRWMICNWCLKTT